MYCTNCGEVLTYNANYCSHCGRKQDQKKISYDAIEDTSGHHPVSFKIEPKIDSPVQNVRSSFSRKVIGLYLAWIFFNFFVLLVLSDGIFSNSNSNSGVDDFWPLNGFDADEYDITEFLVYTIFPLAYLYIRNLIRGRS